jgi:hypothetical protein
MHFCMDYVKNFKNLNNHISLQNYIRAEIELEHVTVGNLAL